ncbi:MAG: enoyl-CoA hydratase/isomerase family protein [Betaproteobacteria bacterium]|nr:enoyl-CoA hydratase/isomerase family protein [Betaproteobacteria bacterium]
MARAEGSFVRYECRDRVATICLNRPEKLNAFNDDMVRELAVVLRHFDLDEDAHVGILCGAGRAFSSGADVHQRQLRSAEDMRRGGGPEAPDAKSSALLADPVNWKPIIAAVHGYALGMGIALALECDLTVAEAGTKFQVTETSRGLATSPKIWELLRFRGLGSFATEVTLSGRYFSAEEALAAGVIDRVAPAGRHLETAHELALALTRNPPLAVRAVVMARRWAMFDSRREAERYAMLNKLQLTEDFAEAARAFAEKRAPGPFKGR